MSGDFPGGSDGIQCGRPGFGPWVGKIPWRRKRQPTPEFLPRKSHGWRSLVQATVRGVAEAGTTERLPFPFLILGRVSLGKWFSAGGPELLLKR